MKMTALINTLIFFVHLSNAQSVCSLSRSIKENPIDSEQIMHLGDHIIAEFLDCINLDAYEELELVLRDAAQFAHATVLNVVTHKFTPIGMSGIALLSESHISIHTWPEYGYVAVDVYTCGNHVNIQAVIDALKEFFKPKKIHQIVIERGCELLIEN